MSWGNLLAIHIETNVLNIFLMVLFDFMTHSMKINLNLIHKQNKIDQIKVYLSVLCVLGVIRLTRYCLLSISALSLDALNRCQLS